LEKPSTSNAVEARSLFNLHSTLPSPAPVLLEALHYKFHPAWQKFLSLLDSPSITSAFSTLSAPAGFMKSNDIRFQYKLSGGAFMDMGCYTVSTLRGAFAADPEECISATAFPVEKAGEENCDKAFKASFRFPNGGVGDIDADLSRGEWWMPGIEIPKVVVKHKEVPVADEKGLREGQSHHKTRTVTIWNFIVPVFWHRIDVVDEHAIKDADGRIVKKWTSKESIKSYTWGDLQKEGTTRVGEEYWSTYRHMLEQFVNRIKGRQESGIWIDGEESIKIMEAIDSGYKKAGLPLRPTSEYM
jgi:predicted dehydrogenase